MTRETRVFMNNQGELFNFDKHHKAFEADFLQSFKKDEDKHLYMMYYDLVDHCAFIIDSREVPDEGTKGTALFVPINATYYSNKNLRLWLQEMGFWDEWLKGSISVIYVFGNKEKYNF